MRRRTMLAAALPLLTGCSTNQLASGDGSVPPGSSLGGGDEEADTVPPEDAFGRLSVNTVDDVDPEFDVSFDCTVTQAFFTPSSPPTVQISIQNHHSERRLITGGSGFPFSRRSAADGTLILRGVDEDRHDSGAEECWRTEASQSTTGTALMDGEQFEPTATHTTTREVWIGKPQDGTLDADTHDHGADTATAEFATGSGNGCIPDTTAAFRSDEFSVDPFGEDLDIEWGFTLDIEPI